MRIGITTVIQLRYVQYVTEYVGVQFRAKNNIEVYILYTNIAETTVMLSNVPKFRKPNRRSLEEMNYLLNYSEDSVSEDCLSADLTLLYKNL